MKTRLLFTIIFALLISFIASQFLNNSNTNISKGKLEPDNIRNEYPYDEKEDIESIDYDNEKITALIKDNGYPESYNFREATKVTRPIKNQGNCGCCWSFAMTTCLSHRLHKMGIEVDLSAQEPISCYARNCSGFDLTDALFYLNVNGTVTEECFPYSLEDWNKNKEIEECITSCKDEKDMIKYRSKNIYSNDLIFDQSKKYDYILLIIDQLINYGPVISRIEIFSLFGSKILKSNIYKKDFWESYKGASHAINIIGYGFENVNIIG